MAMAISQSKHLNARPHLPGPLTLSLLQLAALALFLLQTTQCHSLWQQIPSPQEESNVVTGTYSVMVTWNCHLLTTTGHAIHQPARHVIKIQLSTRILDTKVKL